MALQNKIQTPLASAVRKAGSQVAFAKIVGKSQPWVNARLADESKVPLEDVPAIEEALGIPRHQLRPDYFEAPSAGSPQTQPARHPAEQPPAADSSVPAEKGAGGPPSGDPLSGVAA